MSDRPILFSGPMIRALLDGRKTQTRRVLGKTGRCNIFEPGMWSDSYVMDPGNAAWRARDARYAVGDRLWVKETWQTLQGFDHLKPTLLKRDAVIGYLTGGAVTTGGKTRVSIHMPRWASRITLLVDDVRVQRLQDISENDAKDEGLGPGDFDGIDARGWFRDLWDNINGPDAWDANPWVVALTFRVVRANIDASGAA